MSKKATKTQSKPVVNATTNLANLTGMMGKAASFATDALVCILIEIALKFDALEITAKNVAETLESEEWSNLNRAYNTSRMKAFAVKLKTDAMAKFMALIQWDVDKKGRSYQEIAGVYRVTDESDSKGPKYSARYTNGYNAVMTILRDWIKHDAEAVFAMLDTEKPDAEAFRAYREQYQAEKAKKRQESGAEDGENNPSTEAPALDEDAPQGLRDLYAKCQSVMRNGNAAKSYMTDSAWTPFNDALDALCKEFQDIIQAAPKDDDEETDEGAKAKAA